jgi:hypothetical protein
MVCRIKGHLPMPKRKNHPKVVYRILVARGGIEPPTQGFMVKINLCIAYPER